MSLNNEHQKQDAGSPNPSQEATSEPQASRLKKAYKATSSLLRKCWSKLRALPRFIRWKFPSIVEYIFGILAESRVPIVLWVFFVFLHKPIEEFAVKRLVAPLLAHFNTGWLSSLIALGLALALVAYTFLLGRRRYIVGGKVVLSAGLILLGYGYYRFFRPDFEFYGLFDKACPIVFADLIPLACLAPLGLRLWTCCTKCQARQKEQATESVEGFLTDHPLTEEEEELSGWTSQAQALTQKLLATDTTRAAFSLGIVASWGEGKSSFMGIMHRYLQQAQREVIVMHFNPWLYDKEAQLTKVFFEELRRTLAPYSSKLSRSIDSYAELLLAVDSGWLKLAHELLRQPQRNTAEQFDQLSQDIQELGKQVVIFIDDVDRLTREELLELFNLVRNSSNLPCLYFVLAYDKSYVLKTLQSDGEHMSRYPEKILQEEYPLPKLAPDKIWAVLEQCLNKTQLGQESPGKIQDLIFNLQSETVLSYHLTTLRMVKRMVNAFGSRYELLHKVGVAPFDLFIFELIYYVYPSVYDFLLEMHKVELARRRSEAQEGSNPNPAYNIPSFFFIHTDAKGMRHISLSPELELPSGVSQDEDKLEGQAASEKSNQPPSTIGSIVETLKKLAFELEDGYQKEIVVLRVATLLDLLWGKEREPVLGQINHETYWRRYFYRGLQVGELSKEEFASFLANIDPSERKEDLKRWSQEKPIAFMQEVLGYTPMNQDEMETIVYAMFDWNYLPSVDTPFNYKEVDSLIRRVNLSDHLKRALLLEVLRNEQIRVAAFDYTRARLWGWGHELFAHKIPAPIEAEEDKSTLLSREDLVGVQVDIFNREAQGHTSIPTLYILWWLRCGIREGDRIKRAPEIDQTMRECIEKDIEGFLKYALSGPRDNTYELLDIPWKNLTEFDEYLSKYSENPYVANFREFLSIALEREQELKQEAPVIIKIEPEQWVRMHKPNFGSIALYVLDEDYPFFFTPPEEHED